MKRRMQKIFITLLALFIAGFAMANAYVFDVTNRSPFGTLNLSKLVIKDLTHTGIILDLDSYTIKIDPGNEDQAGGQIRVYEICDENGGNCRKITELYTGSTGVPGPQGPQGPKGDTGAVGAAGVAGAAGASINTGYWNGDDLIFKRDDGFEIRLVNAKNILKGPQGEAGAPGSGGSGGTNANDGALIFYKDSTIYKRFSANTGSSVSVQLTPAGTNGRLCIKSGSDIECYTTGFVTTGQLKNGTLTIKRNGVTGGVFSANTGSNVTVDIDVPVISGSADYICVKNGNNLECSKAQLGIMGGNDGICRYSNGVIDCNYTDQVGNPGNGSTGIYVGGTTGYICTLAGENRINCQENTGNFVYVSATQTIGGTKTFSTSPVVPSKTSAAGNNGTTIATEAQVYAVDQKITTLSGNVNNIPYVSKNNVNQTISGTKTFVTSPFVPNKTSAAGNNGTTIATEAQVYKVQQGVDNLSGNLTKFLTESQIVDLINAAIALIDKPENATITIYQGGTPKGSFTLNQSSDTGIYLELGGETTIQGEDGQRCTYKCTEYREPEHKECIKGEIQCTAPAPSCEGQCTGSGDGITVSGVTLGGYCSYVTQELLNYLEKPFFGGNESSMPTSTEGGRIQCTYAGGSSSSTQSITINGVQNNICVKVNDNTINCNIPLEDLQGGTGTTEGSGLWTSNSTQTVIYPASYTKSNVAIGTNISNNYTLNVNGSGWIQNNLKLGTYLYFEGRPITRNVFNFKQSAVAQKSSPVIEYYNDLLIRPLNIVTDYRTNNYITLGKSGNVGIGGEYSTGNYKLSVYGRQRIYAENSGLSKYIDIYNDGYTSYVTSKWSFMKIGLIGDQDYLGAPLPSSYIYFGRDSVGVNIEPTQNTYNPSNGPTSNGYYVPRFQVNGSIQIKSEYEVTNKTQELNRFKCRSEIEGTIAYWSGQFYGCAKTINGTQINYKRRVFDTSSLAAGDAIPAPIDQTLSY